MRRIGFTGTARGMTDPQRETVARVIRRLREEARLDARERGFSDVLVDFNHGACVGADEQAAEIARAEGYRTVEWPGADTPDARTKVRSHVSQAPLPNLLRNEVIAYIDDVLIAAARSSRPILRSGTWTTIRRAVKYGTPVILVDPQGVERPWPPEEAS